MEVEQPPAVEQQVIPPGAAAEEERKLIVFAPRIPLTLRQQIEGLQGITEQNVNEVGVEALTDWVAKKLADEDVREKAMAEIDAEERRLQERRASIAGILGQGATGSVSQSDTATTPAAGKRGKASQ